MEGVSRKFKTFAELFVDEHQQLNEACHVTDVLPGQLPDYVTEEGTSGEPWVKTAPADRVGLALSGGGIRSAIFNLGLLEALDQRGILSLVDYLSTVSGGGYIGGFWTAWRSRTMEECRESVFPHRSSTDLREKGEPDSRERPETRHLREFSRFLMPRIGINQPEMWFAVATIFGGMLPALLVTFATVTLLFYAWLGIGYLALSSNGNTAIVFVVLTLLLHLERRRRWKNREEQAATGKEKWAALYWVSAIVTTGMGAWLVSDLPARLHCNDNWGWIFNDKGPRRFITLTFEPALAWIALAFLVSIGWIFFEALCCAVETTKERSRLHELRKEETPEMELRRQQEDGREKLRRHRLRRGAVRDQLSSRYLAWAVVAAGVAGIWELSFWLSNLATDEAYPAIGGAGSLTALFAGLYIWLRDWLAKPDEQTPGRSLWRKLLERSKAFLPMLSATAGALSLVVFTVLLMRYYGLGGKSAQNPEVWPSILVGGVVAGAIVLVALKFFDPAHFGLHDFYRGRIARAFLGAAFRAGPGWTDQQKEVESMLVTVGKVALKRDREAKDAEAAGKMPEKSDADREEQRRIAKRRGKQRDYLNDFLLRTRQGARTKPSAIDNRYMMERPEDDLCLTSLPTRRNEVEGATAEFLIRLRLRPIHLICCAANHLTGDALPTLSRGARSVVLSQRGVSIGNDSHRPRTREPALMLSAAQTASAAAFNSQMGEKSLRLGSAGSFLMSALNLRLGLWVVNPASERIASDRFVYEELSLRPIEKDQIRARRLKYPWLSWRAIRAWLSYRLFQLKRRIHESELLHTLFDLPGRAFFRELFGRSSALPEDHTPQLHLSDGGHFENLGLYELIRRHVRYVIVSDAGQDEDLAFDDLGNAIRRVREDFGVEIEIDLSMIRPNEQLESQQHVVVGTIHYDGFEGCDKGTLLYIKPTITGDESGDIQQYRSRNGIFPHEPTSDQFFAEAQWESYRRLGEHIGQVSFAFLDLMSDVQRSRPETVFRQLGTVWSSVPVEVQSGLREVVAKFREFDANFAKEAPLTLRAEFWPEVAAVQSPQKKPGPPKSSASECSDETAIVPYLMGVVALMEEAWLTLCLDDYWSHPSNIGVMSRFQRWWATPSMRRWWVVLSPLCSDGFREFIKINFNLRARDAEARETDSKRAGPKLHLRRAESLDKVENGIAWKQMRAQKLSYPEEATVFEYMLDLEDRVLQVGLAFANLCGEVVNAETCSVARWEGDHLFVPHSLRGAGINSRLLDRLIEEMKRSKVRRIYVTLRDGFPGRRDEAAREARLELIGFYKSRNFVLQPGESSGILAELYLDLQ